MYNLTTFHKTRLLNKNNISKLGYNYRIIETYFLNETCLDDNRIYKASVYFDKVGNVYFGSTKNSFKT